MAVKISVPEPFSYAIILGSSFVKLPLLFRIWLTRSGEGISFAGVLLDLISSTLSASYAYAYGFPFISWGEYPFLMMATLAIAFLILKYQRNERLATIFFLIYTITLYFLVRGYISLPVLWSAQFANFPLSIAGKLLQIASNYRNGHTGQLSAVTALLMSGGTVIRVFTSIEQTGDPIVILTYVATSAVNLVIVGQIIYYWNRTNRFLESIYKERIGKVD